jgi:8-oxo-dGTP diphosphatase
MHHCIGQFTVRGQQQQAGGIDIQPSDRHPARPLHPGHVVEYGRPAVGVVTGCDFTFGLVVNQRTLLHRSIANPPFLVAKPMWLLA